MIRWRFVTDEHAWPAWLTFLNYGFDPSTGRLVIHGLEVCHMVRPGQWIHKAPDGQFTIREDDDDA